MVRVVNFRPETENVYTYWDIDDYAIKSKYMDEQCKPLFIKIGGSYVRLYMEAGGHSYKLCSVNRDWAPTLIIDGLIMHTVMNDPLRYSLMKVGKLRLTGTVLDCCTGLGYTALIALRRGARRVITVEADENVLELARYNPWSRHLADPRVELVLGDITEFLAWVRAPAFDAIIHDPPRPTSTYMSLYSRSLYEAYFRMLRRGGLLYHYVPMTGSKYRGRNIKRGVVNRLREAGFVIIGENKYGVLARKG